MSDTQLEYYKKFEPFFGNWYIKEKVGEGSFGEVFRIEREDFGRTYVSALKVIKIPKSQSDVDAVRSEGLDEQTTITYFKSILEEMVNEFSLMAKLKGQSNIVSYEDHQIVPHENEIGWDIFIRMELLTPLRVYQKDHLQTEKEVVKLGIDMCSALELCDKFEIIHRDIKPENIFISDTGNFKLGDFGIARTAEKSKGASTKVGTSNYMAPEIFRGEKYSNNVDYYSLGLVLHRLLNDNRGPFYPPAPEPVTYQSAEAAKKLRITGEPIPDPAHGGKEISEIIRKASAFRPADRYESASEMKKDLTKLLYKLEGNESDLPASKEEAKEEVKKESVAPVQQPVAPTPAQKPVAPAPVQQAPTQKRLFCTFCGKDITAAKVPAFCRFCGKTIPLAMRTKFSQTLNAQANTGVASTVQAGAAVAAAAPVMSAQPVAQAQPVQKPVTPAQQPVAPAPVKPAAPVQPVTPVQPAAPMPEVDDDDKTLSVYATASNTSKPMPPVQPVAPAPAQQPVAPTPVQNVAPARPVTPQMQPMQQPNMQAAMPRRVMFCRFCGFDLSKDTNPTFCRKCGKDVRSNR